MDVDEERIFEREIFRRIYGPKYQNGEWKSRTKRELEEMSEGDFNGTFVSQYSMLEK